MPQKNVSLRADHNAVVILDQSALPGQVRLLELQTPEEMYEAILQLKVRGAPAIGIFAAYGLYVLVRQYPGTDWYGFRGYCAEQAAFLGRSRPTAVNLNWALKRMMAVIENHPSATPTQLLPLLFAESSAIQQEDMAMCRAIAEYGLSLLQDGMGVLTHCNAGPLATSRYGTALGPLLLGQEKGYRFHVFADETRPLLQGARLTTYELQEAGVDVTLICDNMASLVMKKGCIQACLVGCDRVALNGDTANKIGTSGIAILARHYGIPFYVLGPTSSIDFACENGDAIVIEERDPEEIRSKFYQSPMAPSSVPCYNPAFDVTDAALISAIVTEHGICCPPYGESLAALKEKAPRQPFASGKPFF